MKFDVSFLEGGRSQWVFVTVCQVLKYCFFPPHYRIIVVVTVTGKRNDRGEESEYFGLFYVLFSFECGRWIF